MTKNVVEKSEARKTISILKKKTRGRAPLPSTADVALLNTAHESAGYHGDTNAMRKLANAK